jgi:nucleoside-diphosphate-sugar epimerase
LAWGGLPNYRSLHHYERELPTHYCFLKTLVESGLPNLLVTGTCFEYGMQSGPLNESMASLPNNPYGFAKNVLRQQLEYLKAAHPFALTWSRLFYLYGDGQAESSLYPQLKKAVERGDAVFNMSGGEQLRDYLPAVEVAKYLVDLAQKQVDVGIVNICSGQPISVRTLVESWLVENDWAITPNYGYYSYPDYEPMAFWGDAHKLNSIIGKADDKST